LKIGLRILIILAAAAMWVGAAGAAEPVRKASVEDLVIKAKIAEMKAFVDESLSKAALAEKYIGVLNFDEVGIEASELRIGEAMAELLNAELARSGRYKMTDPNKLKRVLSEIKLSSVGLTSSSSASEMGKIVGTQVMIGGSVIPAGDNYEITLKITEVETARSVGLKSVEVGRRRLILYVSALYGMGKYPADAAFRSIIPGWGQFYNNRPAKGAVFICAISALAAGAVASQIAADQRYDRYAEKKAGTVGYYDDYTRLLNYRNAFIVGAGVAWVAGMVDAYIDAKSISDPKESGSASSLEFTGTGIALGFK
jgi:hypothetical protein